MKKYELPSCPYCNKQIDYIIALNIKNDGEYVCDNCKKVSNIKFYKKTYVYSWICEITAFLIMLVLLMFFKKSSVFDIFIVLLPFLVFYAIVPYKMELKQFYRANKNNKKIKGTTKNLKSSEFYNTHVINNLDDYIVNDRKRINSIEHVRKN